MNSLCLLEKLYVLLLVHMIHDNEKEEEKRENNNFFIQHYSDVGNGNNKHHHAQVRKESLFFMLLLPRPSLCLCFYSSGTLPTIISSSHYRRKIQHIPFALVEQSKSFRQFIRASFWMILESCYSLLSLSWLLFFNAHTTKRRKI